MIITVQHTLSFFYQKTILTPKARATEIISAPIVLKRLVCNTTTAMMNVKVSRMLFMSKYQNPIPKQVKTITDRIMPLSNIEINDLLLAYQQINASIGEANVIPYQIII